MSQYNVIVKNKDKYHLCRLFFYRQLKKGTSIPVATEKIIDFNKQEGKKFSKIKTKWGEGIVDVHHYLLYKQFPKMSGKTIDFSKWFDKTKNLSNNYYLYFLSLFICHGVLFDNFLIGDKEEKNFVKKKFLPSFKKAEKIFGVKPLIFPLLPFENEKGTHWLSYPESLKKILDKHISKK